MRKKIFAVLVVAVGVAFAGYNMMQSQNEGKALSDLALANVEALANDESSKDCYATICNKNCKVGKITYTYQSSSKCSCSLCTGE